MQRRGLANVPRHVANAHRRPDHRLPGRRRAIAFLDDAGELLIPEMIGRWAETPCSVLKLVGSGSAWKKSQLDIEANGLRHAMDIAMKPPGDGHFYAFNHENSQAPDLRLAAHRISNSTAAAFA